MGNIERPDHAHFDEWGLTPHRVRERTRKAEAEVESLTTQLRGAVERAERAEAANAALRDRITDAANALDRLGASTNADLIGGQ